MRYVITITVFALLACFTTPVVPPAVAQTASPTGTLELTIVLRGTPDWQESETEHGRAKIERRLDVTIPVVAIPSGRNVVTGAAQVDASAAAKLGQAGEEMVAQFDEEGVARLEKAMEACGEDEACQMAVAMRFAPEMAQMRKAAGAAALKRHGTEYADQLAAMDPERYVNWQSAYASPYCTQGSARVDDERTWTSRITGVEGGGWVQTTTETAQGSRSFSADDRILCSANLSVDTHRGMYALAITELGSNGIRLEADVVSVIRPVEDQPAAWKARAEALLEGREQWVDRSTDRYTVDVGDLVFEDIALPASGGPITGSRTLPGRATVVLAPGGRTGAADVVVTWTLIRNEP